MQYSQKTDRHKIQKFQSHIGTFVTNAGNVRMKSMNFSSTAQHSLVGQDLLIIESSRSHSDTSHLVEIPLDE